jgi:hypothetical protein
MKTNDSSLDNAKTIEILDPPEMCDRSMASAHARGGVGVERDNLMDGETIISLEKKPVRSRTTIKDSQTLNVANAKQNKRMRGQHKEIKTQATLFPTNRYTPEERMLIKRLSKFDNADRRFLLKAITWNMADRKPTKHNAPKRNDEDSLNLEGGALTEDYRGKLTLKRAWGEYLNVLPWDLFVTLTSLEPIHPESLDKLSNQIIHKLNREIYGQNYYKTPNVGVLVAKAVEMQKRYVLHSHMLIAGVPEHFYRKDLWRFIWEKKGYVNKVEQYDSKLGAGYYLSKYVAKEANVEMYGNTSMAAHVAIPQELAGL